MNMPGVSENNSVSRFPSLSSLWLAHSELLHKHHENGSTRDCLTLAEEFVSKGRETGALLDAEDERRTAQSILDYWAATLYDAGYKPSVTTLYEFDPQLAPHLPDELCPYIGLDSFHEDNSDIFFGRATLINTLVQNLRHKRFVAVVGPSGSGKSSLVLGGLISELKNGAITESSSIPIGSDQWLYAPRIVPGSTPLDNLLQAFYSLIVQITSISDNDTNQFVLENSDLICSDPKYFNNILKYFDEYPVVLVIDQFEELFTLCNNEMIKRAFVDCLLSFINYDKTRHTLVLTMRIDFESHIARLPELQTLFEDSLLHVTPLNAAELRRTIEEPANRIGLKFETGLVDALMQDILGEPAALPLLQFTLLKLWENRERNRITWEAYNRLGGGRLALARSADVLYEELIPEDQSTAKRILLRLVRPGEGLEVTSNRVRLETLYRFGEARDRIARVLQRFIDARLLRISEGDSATDVQVEVAHEALVRNWPRLVDWIEDERETIRQRLRVTEAADKWHQLGRDSSALLRGILLEEAIRYQDLNDLEIEYVQVSQEAQEQEIQEKENARRRELEQAQKLAEAQSKSAKRLRSMLISLAVLFAVIVMFGFSYIQSQRVATAQDFVTQGRGYEVLGQYDRAIEAFTNAIGQAPSVPNAYHERGRMYENQQSYELAKSDFMKAISLGFKPVAYSYHGVGVSLLNLRRCDEAIPYFTKSIEHAPEYGAAYRNRGLCYEQKGDFEQAISDFTVAIEFDASLSDLGDIDRILANASNLSDTIIKNTIDIKAKPDSIEAYIKRAQAFTELGDHYKAIFDYTAAIQLSAKLFADRGLSHYRLGNYQQAIKDYTDAIDSHYQPLSWVYLARGDCYLERKEYESAIADYTESISLDPTSHPSVYSNRAFAYNNLMKYDEALADYQKALELDPNYVAAQEGLQFTQDALENSIGE